MIRLVVIVAIVWAVLCPPLIGHAAPPDLVTKCSQTEYRQEHLAQCNRSSGPGFGPVGGGGGQTGGGGLLGAIGNLVGRIL